MKIQSRFLRVDGGFAGAAAFNVDFFVVPSADFRFQAEAYECDDQNQQVQKPEPKSNVSPNVRICVQPNSVALNFGLLIFSIDSWNFTRSNTTGFPNITQAVVEPGGLPAKNGLTILMCVPGSEVCTFRTELIPGFFESDGTIAGVGYVWLQYSSMPTPTATSRMLLLSAEISMRRDLQYYDNFTGYASDPANFAGQSNVTVDVPVVKINVPGCQYDHKFTDWWLNEPMKNRYLYIGVVNGTIAALAGSLLLCFLFPCGAKRKVKEVDDEAVEVNVGVNSENKEENLISTLKSSQSSTRLDITRNSDHTEESESEHPSTSSSRSRTKRRSKEGDEELAIRKSRNTRGSSRELSLPTGDAEDVKPKEEDVCFNQDNHPGTHSFMRIVRKKAKEDPNAEYGPLIYKDIKDNLKGRRLYLRVSKGKYREPSKKEVIELIGQAFQEMKESLGRKSTRLESKSNISAAGGRRRSSKTEDRPSSSKSVDELQNSSRCMQEGDEKERLVKRKSKGSLLDEEKEPIGKRNPKSKELKKSSSKGSLGDKEQKELKKTSSRGSLDIKEVKELKKTPSRGSLDEKENKESKKTPSRRIGEKKSSSDSLQARRGSSKHKIPKAGQ